MIKPLELLDDLLAGEITLELAFKWYGSPGEFVAMLVHLERDKCVEVYEMKSGERRKVEGWEISDMERAIVSGSAAYDFEKIGIVLTDQGAKQVS